MFLKSIRSSRQHSTIRSVKYKLSRDHSMPCQGLSDKKNEILKNSQTSSNKKKPYNASGYYLGNFHKNLSELKISVDQPEEEQSHIKQTASTFYNTTKKPSYLNNFNFIVNMEKNRYKKHEKQQQQQNQKLISQSEMLPRVSRVQLPTLNQLDSHFTVLDNVHLPMAYITGEIEKVSKGIKAEQEKIVTIQKEIKQIQKKVTAKIEQIQNIGFQGFKKLRNMLKANRVAQQQCLMKAKNQFVTCNNYLPEYYKKLQQSKQRIVQLQEDIFKGVPFELTQQNQFESVETQYF